MWRAGIAALRSARHHCGGLGGAEQIALARIAAELEQVLTYLLGLDSLCRGHETQSVAEAEHRFDDACLLGLVQDLADEGSVDLDDVELELAQMIETRIAGAEIVEGDAHADIAKRLQHGLSGFELLHHRTLGDLHHQPMRREANLGQQAENSRCDVGGRRSAVARN